MARGPGLVPDGDIFYTRFEPKVKFRFILYIAGIASYLIHSTSRPSPSAETITIEHINTKFKLNGKWDWNTLNITMYDPVSPSGAQQVMEWVRQAHESVTGRDGYQDQYKKDIELKMLGPAGDIVESWTIKGAFLSEVGFGDLAWADGAAPAEITGVLTYDYAILEF